MKKEKIQKKKIYRKAIKYLFLHLTKNAKENCEEKKIIDEEEDKKNFLLIPNIWLFDRN